MIKSKVARAKAPAKAAEGVKKPGAVAAGIVGKKRRVAVKKKDGGTSSDSKDRRRGPFDERSMAQQLHAFHHAPDQHPQLAPRFLPEIDGVTPLTQAEVHSDLRAIQTAFSAFQAKIHALLPASAAKAYAGSDVYVNGSKQALQSAEDAYGSSSAFMYQRRRARANGVITPEEVVESVPVARRAVRITQRELAAMKRERDDLERDFMRLRCKLVWQLGEMKRIQKQQDRVQRALSKDVVEKAKMLESSRRRTNALQDVMNELDARGTMIMRLTRYKHQLEKLLRKNDIVVPEVDEAYIGDRVKCPFGQGVVVKMDDKAHVFVIDLACGGTAYVQEDEVEVLSLEMTYLEAEKELKQRLFDKVGALVNPDGKIVLSSRRRRQRGDDHGSDGGESNESMDDESDGDDSDADESSSEDETDDLDVNPRETTTPSAVLSSVDDDESSRPRKKRKTMVMPPLAPRKHQKSAKLLDFTACKLRITPDADDAGLFLSPLSVLPDRVAAVGPTSLQWMGSYLPSRLKEMEDERYTRLQMQGEIERLRFQLSKAEEERTEAQQHAADQLESINHLVTQMDKLRETVAAKEAREKELKHEQQALKAQAHAHAGPSTICPHCSESLVSSKKTAHPAQPTTKATKANGKAAVRLTRRPRTDSSEEGSGEHKQDSTGVSNERETDDEDSSDPAAKPAPRTLRPRRGSSRADKSGK